MIATDTPFNWLRLFRAKVPQGMILVAIVMLLPGCASPSMDRLTIHLSESGAISINGKRIPLAEVPDRLRKMGATQKTGVRIETPPGISKYTLQTITKTLASQGYTRLFFTAPEQVSATVKKKQDRPLRRR
jgi:biopolymer transport protein ExbD